MHLTQLSLLSINVHNVTNYLKVHTSTENCVILGLPRKTAITTKVSYKNLWIQETRIILGHAL